ncbi:MAG: hypothetical protein Q9181_006709 [Wetmoreana brouardii]
MLEIAAYSSRLTMSFPIYMHKWVALYVARSAGINSPGVNSMAVEGVTNKPTCWGSSIIWPGYDDTYKRETAVNTMFTTPDRRASTSGNTVGKDELEFPLSVEFHVTKFSRLVGTMASSIASPNNSMSSAEGIEDASALQPEDTLNAKHSQPVMTVFAGNDVELQAKCAGSQDQECGNLQDGSERNRPLQLLDLPLDILKEIIKEITHTNDLTSLSLTCSALHGLATPWIYSRFDIVWPDTHNTSDSRQGVDALTHGLATLVMGEVSLPAETNQKFTCTQCGALNVVESPPSIANKSTWPPRRRGNHYPQYTRKFSLGNGPDEWIKEYLIDRESGKMLGTLVALAVARMPNLETFVWDMPTGVLRDCWLALSSLGKLEKVWIRFHDNKEIVAAPHFVPGPGRKVPGKLSSPIATRLEWSYSHVEYPSFSVLPPLQSLNVLDIDEIAYVEEMSVLVERSIESLRELRVGIAPTVSLEGFASIAVSTESFSDDTDPSTTWKGAIDLLMSKIYNNDQRKGQRLALSQLGENLRMTFPSDLPGSVQNASSKIHSAIDPAGVLSNLVMRPGPTEIPKSPTSNATTASLVVDSFLDPGQPKYVKATASNTVASCTDAESNARQLRRLKLEHLELERVNLSVPVMLKTIDWSMVTTLTILNCDSHEQLWKAFRRTFTPRLISGASPGVSQPQSRRQSQVHLRSIASCEPSSIPTSEYRLSLRRIHTNTISPALISFLRETLAPNSLEWLFLRDGGTVSSEIKIGGRETYASPVTVRSIFRGPLRRHKASLKKLMIDSSSLSVSGWRKWKWDRELLSYVFGGKMRALREVAFALDYKDWVSSSGSSSAFEQDVNRKQHFFLQSIPQIPHVRSMFIIHTPDHAHTYFCDPKEFALQIMDVVALRPDVELCYLGIGNKCFEIMEGTSSDDEALSRNGPAAVSAHHGSDSTDSSDEDSDDDEDDEDDDGDPGPGVGTDVSPTVEDSMGEDSGSENERLVGDSDDESENLENGPRQPKLRLREILFYDDKISIFKARHGRL